MMIIVPGPASMKLGSMVAKLLDSNLISVESKVFPDGESYVRFTGDPREEDIVLIQTTGPKQNTNLIQLLLLVDNAQDMNAKSVTAVVPYLAYCRQDRRFRSGEAISIRTVLRLLKAAGTKQLITVNIHNPENLGYFGGKTQNLSAMSNLAQYFIRKGLTHAFALAPDKGALDLIKEAAVILKGGYGWLRKSRDRITGEIAFEEESLEVRGKDAIIFDDIISTGGTMAAAVRILKEQGARKVYVACVHPLLINEAKERILRSGAEEIIGTDCVDSEVSVVTVAPLIAETLRRSV